MIALFVDRALLWLRGAAWFSVVLIAYLSLVPQSIEMRTPAPAGASGMMELLQNFSPGRHPGLDGVVWSSAGAILGSLIVAVLRSRVR